MFQRFYIFVIFISIAGVLAGQSKKEKISRLANEAELLVEDEDWDKAYETYDKIIEIDATNPFFKFKKGFCALHIANKKEETIRLFEEVLKESPEDVVVLYYLGRAYHRNYEFEKAIGYFDKYLATNPTEKEYVEDAKTYRANSVFGKNVTKTMLEANIKNMGAPVNTSDNEYVPVISADESILLFTYKGTKSVGGLQDENFRADDHGTYYEDVYITKKISDSLWGDPVSVGENINTNHNDASIAISPDGQELYTFYSDEKNGGDIYVCRLEGDIWGKPSPLNSNINTKYWEGSCSITADGKELYFASERPGGYGKKDLYVSTKQANGDWGPAVNLGPIINTKLHDDDPFIHPDGITLFFSSQGHKGLGGFDIMYAVKQDGKWTAPQNMGYPLNTTDDDRYYVITAKGDKGFFSSNRNSSVNGGHQDIYTVTPGVIGERPVLAMIIGDILGNDMPLEASIEITKKSSGEIIGPIYSNKKTGKYLVALSPGENYIFKIKAEGYADYAEDFDIARLHRFIEVKKDFHLSKDGFVDPHPEAIKTLNDALNTAYADTVKKSIPVTKINDPIEKPVTTITNTTKTTTNQEIETPVVKEPTVYTDPCEAFKLIDFSNLKNKSLNNPEVYKILLAIAKDVSCSKIKFKVQIGAYLTPENFKWKHLAAFGTPDQIRYPDGLTRFTQGKFTSIVDAEKLRQKIIAKNQKDAWIVGFVDGKRYTLEELIMVDFFNKNIGQFNKHLQLLRDYIVFTTPSNGIK